MADLFASNTPLIPSLQEAYSRDPRRLLVQSLMQQGQETMQTPTYSPGAALAKALTIGLGGISNVALTADYQKQNQGALEALQNAAAGAGGTPQWTNPDTGEVAIPQTTGIQNMVKALMGSPATAGMGAQMAMQNATALQQAKLQLLNELAKSGKTLGPDGQITDIPGAAETTRKLAAAESGGKALGQAQVDLAYKPTIEGAVEAAKNPALVQRAVSIANGTAPIEVWKNVETVARSAPIEISKKIAEINEQNKFEPVTITVPMPGPNGTTVNREVTTTRAELQAYLSRKLNDQGPQASIPAPHAPTEQPPPQNYVPSPLQSPPSGVPVPSPPPVPGQIPPGGGAAPVPQPSPVPQPTNVGSAPATPPVAPTVPPSPAPPAAPSVPAAPQGTQFAGLPFVGAKPIFNPTVAPMAQAAADEVKNDRELANKGMQDKATVRAILDFLPKVATGPLAETRLEAARILKLLGADDDAVKQVMGTDISSGQLLQKKFLELSTGAARTLGAREPGSVISMFTKAYPNIGTDEKAIRLQANAIYMNQQRLEDLANGKDAFLNESVNAYPGSTEWRGLKGFNEQFNKTNAPEFYLHAAEAMSGAGEAWQHVSNPQQQQYIINLIPSGTTYLAPDGNMRVKR